MAGKTTSTFTGYNPYQQVQQPAQQSVQPVSPAAPTAQENLSKMANYKQVSPFEKWVYGWMPNIANTGFGKVLSAFGNTWAGKALGFLDVPAEGVERTVGTFVQAADYANKNQGSMEGFNLSDAWNAGSLFYDTTNLPGLSYDASGKITGIKIPTDLPGLSAMTKARQQLASGMSLAEVKASYYDNLGALSLRAQLHDTFFHVVADPLLYIMPALKPVDWINATRFTAMTAKVSVEALQADLEAAKVAETAAKLANNVDEAAQATAKIAEITSSLSKVETGTLKPLTTFDKFAIFITGGDPLHPGKLATGLAGKLNPFNLTPESRCRELITVLQDGIGSNVVSAYFNHPNAEEEITKAIMRIAQGSRGPEFGASLLSIEGRTAQSFIGGVEAKAMEALTGYRAVAKERTVLQMLADTLGDNPSNILKNLGEDSGSVMRSVEKSIDVAPDVLKTMVQNGEITADSLATLGETLKGLPYNKEMFVANLMNDISDHAMQQAIVQFGVSNSKNILNRWASTMKSAETLAFIRMNPANTVRNAVNNEVTMLARGVFGTMSLDEIDSFWKAAGFVPERLAQGFGLSGEAEKVTQKADQTLAEALKSTSNGAPEKIKSFLSRIELGKFDFSNISRNFESMSSKRAFTSAYMTYLHDFAKYPRLSEFLDTPTRDVLRGLSPNLESTIDGAVRSARAINGKLDELIGGNLTVNIQSILDDASKVAGVDVSSELGSDIVNALHNGLPDAVASGKIDEFMVGLQQKMDAHLNDIFEQNIVAHVDMVKNRVVAGGPQLWYKELGEAQDMWHSAEIQHRLRMPELADLAHSAANEQDWAKANSLWTKINADEMTYFARREKLYNSYLDGLTQGWKELEKQGIHLPDVSELKSSFTDVRKEWTGFFSERNKTWTDFYAARLDGKEYKMNFDEINARLNERYLGVVAKEDVSALKADEAIATSITDPALQTSFRTWRDKVGEIRVTQREGIVAMHEALDKATTQAERVEIYNKYMNANAQLEQVAKNLDQYGDSMMQGDKLAQQMFSGGTENYMRSAERVKINNNSTRSIVERYTDFKFTEGQAISDVPEEVLQKAMNAFKADQQAGKVQSFIGPIDKVLPKEPPYFVGFDDLAQKQYGILDKIAESAKTRATMEPTLLKDLPPDMQEKITAFLDHTKQEYGSIRFAATRYGEYGRDAALLNYNRRVNFDTWANTVFPYSFWTTGSMVKWAVHSIDRPAVFSTYLRFKKFIETAGAPESGFPSRFKDNIRIKLPFLPAWMGDQYINPQRILLPFDAFAQPFEQYNQNKLTKQGAAERLLDTALQNKTISQQDYNTAMTHQGPVWQNALSQAEINDESLNFDAWDFATLMTSPHAPLLWAYNAARGHPEEIGPFTPLTRTLKNVATTLGVADWNNSPMNIEGQVRKKLGLPAFDKWDDYRTDRMLTDMAGTGEYSVGDVKVAMVLSSQVQSGQMTAEQAKAQNPVYAEAIRRANIEYSGGALGTIMGMVGLPPKSYPVGERNLRSMQDQFTQAYTVYHKVDDQAQAYIDAHPELDKTTAEQQFYDKNPNLVNQASALSDFFTKHPEYEAKLGLWDKPEVRIQKFMVDQVWSAWNAMPKLYQNEAKVQLGQDFQDQFLSPTTRSYDSVPVERMAVWLKLMGGTPPGTLKASTNAFGRLNLASPDIAYRTQVFYDMRNKIAPDYYNLQTAYFALPAGAQRKAFLVKNPSLSQYWNWRSDYMNRNPDVVPYLSDTPPQPGQYHQAQQNPVFTWQEYQTILPQPTQALILQHFQQGMPLPDAVAQQLELLATQYNVQGGGAALLALIGQSIR